MKCSACQNNECEKKYANRDKCVGKKEEIECTCTCQVSLITEITTSVVSVGAGIAAAAGGVALTVMTGGIIAIISGAALVGAGSSMIMNPIQKQISGECMTLKDTAQDIVLGGGIGAITGPIGVGGSAFAKGASTLAKLGIRAGAGATAGAVSGAIGETARCCRGEYFTWASFRNEFSWKSFGKATGIGAIAGTIGGASTHLGSNVSSKVTGEVGKAVTRISVQATTAAATDAGLQLFDKGDIREIDTKQLLLNTIGQITVATTSEVSQNFSKRTETYSNKVNTEMVNDSTDNKEERSKLLAGAKDVNSLSTQVVEENLQKTNEYNKVQSQISEQTTHKENVMKINQNPDLTQQQKNELRQTYAKQNNLPETKTMKGIKQNIHQLKGQAGQLKSSYIGDKNIHFLHGERTGQIAIDIGETGERGAERAVFEKHGDKWVYADHTLEHDYDGLRKDVQNLIPDPFDALRPEHLLIDSGIGENPENPPEEVDTTEEPSGDKKND